MKNQNLIFIKGPTTNLYYAFGLFAQLTNAGWKTELNPEAPIMVLNPNDKTIYTTKDNIIDAIELITENQVEEVLKLAGVL